ncbi:SDR family oxidoreductase [Halopelagius longus]|uniref:SDR family oxidoreductase n=1 Tax=Halopelagius longus TaxID=1236180 RepID=A0A1H1DBI3_9EURY|nr:SDR family oxidoreductase [Halopelagius longus]RDI71253.1 SDR family oxidoreductase [Halopelagius longus]SDQ73588.1 Short-chain dehydrogenase [Halopelagius longus]
MHPKTVLITGCSSGIGRATARQFLDEDWLVYATARNPADIETLGEEGCEIATLDVTEQDDVDRVVERIIDEEGHISALVNNAGFGQFGPLEDVPTEQVHRQFDVNVYGPHRLIRAVLPHMREQGDGTIVNVSSVAGRVSFPGGGVYAGSKFAVEAMTDALRNEVAEYGIDAVVVEPGPVTTNFSNRAQEEVSGEDDIPGIERSGAYESFYALFEDTRALGGGGPGSISADRVADDIVDAASSTQPKARYQPGTVARVSTLARFLPDAWFDTTYRLLQKLV